MIDTRPMTSLAMLLALVVGLLLSHDIRANDLVLSRATWEDTSASLPIEEVVKQTFVPVQLALFRGYTDSAHWLRLTVRPPSKGDEAILLIRQPSLHDVRLFEADPSLSPEHWTMRTTGSLHEYKSRERIGSQPGFIVKPGAPEATYYLRVQSKMPVHLTAEVFEPADAYNQVRYFDVLQACFATSMLALLAFAIYTYLLDRQAVVGVFALHQAVYTLYGSAEMGYIAPLMLAGLPSLADTILLVSYCATGFTMLLFGRTLFASYDPPRLLMRGLDILLLAFPVQIALIALGHPAGAGISNFVVVRIVLWYLAFMAFTLRKDRTPSRLTLRLTFTGMAVLFTTFWLTYYINPTATQGIPFGRLVLIASGLLMGTLFAALASAYARNLLREALESAANLTAAKRTLEIERRQKLDAEMRARTDYLTGVFNRRHFVEQAENELERATRCRRPLALMMIDIDLFKSVNDSWGHGIGDRILQRVSLSMQDTLRNIDLFGRTGGEEFAAVLPETDKVTAAEVAERLRAAVARVEVVPPGGDKVRVTISVGVSERQGRDISLERLMNEADHALYRAKSEGRNRVKIHDGSFDTVE